MIRNLKYILLFLVVSCKSLTIQQGVYGEFYKGGEDYKYTLKLNRDSTFFLSMKYQDAMPQCYGKWQYLGQDTLLLKCNELKNISETLSSGYMANREKKVLIIGRNKIKLDQTILKRIN